MISWCSDAPMPSWAPAAWQQSAAWDPAGGAPSRVYATAPSRATPDSFRPQHGIPTSSTRLAHLDWPGPPGLYGKMRCGGGEPDSAGVPFSTGPLVAGRLVARVREWRWSSLWRRADGPVPGGRPGAARAGTGEPVRLGRVATR